MASAFVEVVVRPIRRGRPPKKRWVEVQLPGGSRLRFAEAASQALVEALIAVVIRHAGPGR
jgi:hypothetical protein